MYTAHEAKEPVHKASVGKRAWQGGLVAFILIAAFLATAGAPNPAWPRFWWIRPLVMVPLAGAAGGVFFYFLDFIRCQGGWKKLLAIITGLVVYIIALWLGTVLGLDGTMWN